MKIAVASSCAVGIAAAVTLVLATPASAAVQINPIFSNTFGLSCAGGSCGLDPSQVVSLSGNAAAMGAITAATTQIASQFSNNLTENIVFFGYHGGTDSFLGASISGQTVYSYNQYTTALAAQAGANPQNTVLNTAVANLGAGNGAGISGANVAVNTTDARVLGLGVGVNTAFGPGDATAQFTSTGAFVGSDAGGTADAVVFLNIDQPLFYTRPIPTPGQAIGFDAESTMEHEIDETLGIGGAGSQLNSFNADPNYAQDVFGVRGPLYGVMDLYRYAAPGVGSFDPTDTAVTGCPAGAGFTNTNLCTGANSPYFSVDGGLTSIDEFNQAFPEIGGDAGDWGLNLAQACPGNQFIGGTGDVQDAFNCNNNSADVRPGTPSFKAFEAIGFNAVPEPDAWLLMIAGFALAGTQLRRRAARARL
ncbi:PEPxxWA-CTERM sorting domain-containing protein [Phenylobacterium sp.]|jgi:hypothetical protein|uniref:PEPxxWA-CTERM sorting domain-containing protein n=1 Tax=Phenylobacterium sp. TaxID=1871053 RepID=UPI002F3E7831